MVDLGDGANLVVDVEIITVHHLGVYGHARLLLHVGYGVALHGNGLVCVQLLGHALVRLVVSVDRLRGETAYHSREVVDVVGLHKERGVSVQALEERVTL